MDAKRVLLVLMVVGAVGVPQNAAAQTWSGGSSAPSYDRYGQPITPSAPSITQRTQSAFSDTGSALKEGFDAGMQAAGQTINTASGSSTSVARPAAAPAWQNPPAAATPAPTWASNPPAAVTPISSNGSGASRITAIDGGWTSIGTSVPAPPMLIPLAPPPTTTNYTGSSPVTGVRTAQNSPAVTLNDPQPLHSVLADPAAPAAAPAAATATSAASAADWSSTWSDPNKTMSPVTVRDTNVSHSPASAGPSLPAPSNTAGPRYNDGWPESSSWSQPTQPGVGSGGLAGASTRPASTTTSTNGQFAGFGGQGGIQSTNGQGTGGFAQGGMGGSPMGGGLTPMGANQTNPGQTNPGQSNTKATNEPQPWMPLIASVLVLAGSLAANLYLGVSYLDARQKYQSLVRKTADTFRRVKAVAA